MCHNFITHVNLNPEQDIDLNTQMEMIMDRLMSDINTKVTLEVANFGQQYVLQKGPNK